MTKYHLLVLLTLLCINTPLAASQEKTVIYRGDSPGSLSLPSIMLAHLQKPDFIELPVMLSRDDVPIVFDDIFLQRKTNVAQLFPNRHRRDGNYYLIDFDLAELSQLTYLSTQNILQIQHRLCSFADVLRSLALLREHTGTTSHPLPVAKYPWFHHNESKKLSRRVIDTLIAGSGALDSPLFLMCYDPDELQRIHRDLLPGLPVEVKLIQAAEGADGQETMRQKRNAWYSYNYGWLFTRLGLRVAAGYASSLMIDKAAVSDEETLRRIIDDSHALKMQLYIALNGPAEPPMFDTLLNQMHADGIALAFPDQLRDYLEMQRQKEEEESAGSTQNFSSPKPFSILADPEPPSRRLQGSE